MKIGGNELVLAGSKSGSNALGVSGCSRRARWCGANGSGKDDIVNYPCDVSKARERVL